MWQAAVWHFSWHLFIKKTWKHIASVYQNISALMALSRLSWGLPTTHPYPGAPVRFSPPPRTGSAGFQPSCSHACARPWVLPIQPTDDFPAWPWFQPCLLLTVPEADSGLWINCLAWPWPCLITTNFPGEPDFWLNLAVVSGSALPCSLAAGPGTPLCSRAAGTAGPRCSVTLY